MITARPLARRRSTAAWSLLLLSCAVALPLVVMHALGLREHTAVLSGTLPDSALPAGLAATLGAGYALAWFACVLLSPTLATAALFRFLWDRVAARA